MNWLKRIAQKSMPLPVSVPAGERENMGIERMDTKMTQETADRLRQQYPGIEIEDAYTLAKAREVSKLPPFTGVTS
ncbi:hypothetical protein LCGC14_2815340 [marine sediment metagenome]|uniref:Uncharacterized protein n=1 Tax=marine sediment metagenome TaxID=412755 RepID=A0A0F8Z5G8_9ZZZZ